MSRAYPSHAAFTFCLAPPLCIFILWVDPECCWLSATVQPSCPCYCLLLKLARKSRTIAVRTVSAVSKAIQAEIRLEVVVGHWSLRSPKPRLMALSEHTGQIPAGCRRWPRSSSPRTRTSASPKALKGSKAQRLKGSKATKFTTCHAICSRLRICR